MNDDAEQGDDVALKIVHTADWHLGARYLGFPEADRPKLTRARLAAVERILSVAQSIGVDAILCAGDLFDEPTPDKQWWQPLAELFLRRARAIPIFLLPGNHDPLTEQSVYHRAHPFRQALPEAVHVVDRDDYAYELSEEAVLYATPCRKQAGELDLAARLPAREPGDTRIRIGMVHGQTFDLPDHQTNFPIARDAARARGLDYLALGDTHAFREVEPGAAVPTVYPGTPEQLTWGEHNTGKVAAVFFRRQGRRALVREENVAHWTWRKETVTELDGLRRLRDAPDLKRAVLQLTVQLRAEPPEHEEVLQILAELAGTDATHGRVGVLEVDTTHLELDTRNLEALLSDAPPVVLATIRRLREAEQGEAGEKATRALGHLYRLVRGAGA